MNDNVFSSFPTLVNEQSQLYLDNISPQHSQQCVLNVFRRRDPIVTTPEVIHGYGYEGVVVGGRGDLSVKGNHEQVWHISLRTYFTILVEICSIVIAHMLHSYVKINLQYAQ